MSRNLYRVLALAACLFLCETAMLAQNAVRQQYYDAAIYDLKGNVKNCVLYKDGDTITYNFTKDGQEFTDIHYDEIRRDSEGRIILRRLSSLVRVYSYDLIENEKFLYQDILFDHSIGYGSKTYHIRNVNGVVIKQHAISSIRGNDKIENTFTYTNTYTNHKFDNHGNWIYRVEKYPNGGTEVQTRTITYWDDDNANNTGKNAEEAENPFTKLSRMARNDAITLDKHDITVADLLRIPFYSGNGIVTYYDLEESMKKNPTNICWATF